MINAMNVFVFVHGTGFIYRHNVQDLINSKTLEFLTLICRFIIFLKVKDSFVLYGFLVA